MMNWNNEIGKKIDHSVYKYVRKDDMRSGETTYISYMHIYTYV